ncbi:MAG: 3D domain-containing protein [Syntrophomonadaceae bacterium]|nr:3D domain-containing protein [Syntrophomonadaceae bacterium]
MLGKKIIIPVFILSLFFTGLFLAKSDAAMAASNLSLGSRGTEVVQLQETLNAKGYGCGDADGIFGPQTQQSVIKFQGDSSLAADGIVGPQTRQALGLADNLSSASDSTVSRGSDSGKVLTMVATAYDGCYECNKPYYGQPSYIGLPLQKGIVAVDPRVIPMGTRLYVEGYGEAIAADQGNAIKGNRIDLFFDTHQQALDYGMKTVKVTIL